jgi:hypothetical protein
VNIMDTTQKDRLGFLCLPMTQTEDRILRQLSKNGGVMSSEDICEALFFQEGADNIYGALPVLDFEGYTTSARVIPWVWKRNYLVGTIALTAKGQRHVDTTPPVRMGWTRIFLSLILLGALLSVIQSVYKTPDYGPIGLAMLVAGILMLVGRRFGVILMERRKHP